MRPLVFAALLAVSVPAAALADAGVHGDLAQSSTLALPVANVATLASASDGDVPQTTAALSAPFVGGIVYRPRAYRSHAQVIPTTTQIYGGLFDPTDNFSTGFDGGFRIGPQVSPNVQLGFMMDWWHRSETQRITVGPGGIAGSTLQQDLSSSTANLIPLMGFVQVSGDENMAVIPYAGAGVGYEWLFLSGSGVDQFGPFDYDATYGGFGWQAWGGAQVPMSGRSRLMGEVFYNGADLGRDVDIAGITYREEFNLNGVGARFGVSWGF